MDTRSLTGSTVQMIITLSAASHFYWLARYVVRAHIITNLEPWQNEEAAQNFADAFGLDQIEPIALKKALMNPDEPNSFAASLANIQENIQAVRGIISQDMFEAFNSIWRRKADYDFVSTEIPVAISTMDALPEKAAIFWELGLLLERFDAALRLEQPISGITLGLEKLAEKLSPQWQKLHEYVNNLIQNPNWGNFYMLTFFLHNALERGI